MPEFIEDDKFVELTYRVIDKKTGDVYSTVEFPIGYVHGANDVLSAAVIAELRGKTVGDTVDLPIDCDKLYGPRDESLVFTDKIDNVPEDFRELGATITMENEQGKAKDFIVTKIDENSLTVDGNNPLCGREVVFTLEVLSVRDATDEEIEAGGPTDANPDINEILQ